MSSRDRGDSRRGAVRRRNRSPSRSPSRSRSRSRSRSYSSRGAGRYRNRAQDEDGDPHFSDYYRDRFGSESPQEYQNLRVTNIDPTVSNDDLRDSLEKYLGRYGVMNVKIIRQMDLHQRIAYVNFERVGDARNARHGCLQKLVDLLGRRLTVDPAGVTRDQEGRFLKQSTNGSRSPTYPSQRGGFPPRPAGPFRQDREFNRDNRQDDFRDRRHYEGDKYRSAPSSPRGGHRGSRYCGDRPPRRPNDFPSSNAAHCDWQPPRPPFDDQDDECNATRTLFVGSLHADVTKTDLQRMFCKFGVIEQIDIKNPHDGAASYAFVRFQNLAMAQEAKQGVFGRCGSWKIGYGKPTPSRRLWVGGLGPNTSLAWLEKEFDRFGAIEKIDYVRGENHAYVLFASDEAATEAWRKMKGMQLKDGIEKHLLQVDFADSTMYDMAGGDSTAAKKSADSSSGADKMHQSSKQLPLASPPSKRPMSSPSSSKRPTTPNRHPRTTSPAVKQKDLTKKSASTARSPRTPPLPISTTGTSSPITSPSLQKSATIAGLASGVVISDGTVSSTTTSPPIFCELSAQNLDELHHLRSPCWTGALVLKKSAYPIRLYKLTGDDDLIDAYLRNERGESVQLAITQRLKLDQPKEEDVQKWLSSPSDQHAFLLAAANTNALATQGNLADLQPRPLKLLVKYFKEKEAAGVVSVVSNRRLVQLGTSSQPQQQNGVLYTFPHCQFADLLTSTLCPKLAVMQHCSEECLLVVLQKSMTQ